MRPLNDVTVATDSLPGGLQSVTKHVLLGMVLGEITDWLHLPQHAKGSASHTSFHRVVRRCQNQFWSDWQENMTSLSRVNPRVAASRVRQMFSGQSRRDHSRRFSALFAGPHETGGQFDGPFSVAELVGALSRCAESAVGGDGLPYSLFKVALPWWRSALLNLFNLDVPTMWKHSVSGDFSVPGNYRPISLASCCFKVFEHMVHSSIAPCISPQLHHCQGGFRWGADMMAGSLILHMRSTTHTFVAFVDIFKAFDTSWVEATMVELFSVGVHGRMWALIAHFVHGTFSQVRSGSDLS